MFGRANSGFGSDDRERVDSEGASLRPMARSRRVALCALLSVALLALAGCEVGMGSTRNQLGADPEKVDSAVPGFWLNIDGPGTDASQGDRFNASRLQIGCTPTCVLGPNPDYDPTGAMHRVRVSEPVSDQALTIQVYDPAFVGSCRLWLTEAQQTMVAAAYPGDLLARERYNDLRYCPRDQYEGMATTYLVREPDGTPLDDTDNPVVCAITFSPRSASLSQLVAADGTAATTPVGALDRMPLGEVFHQHVSICTVPGPDVVAGTYVVQVRTNAASPASMPRTVIADPSIDALARTTVLQTDSTIMSAGHNRYSVRAGWGSDPGADDAGQGIWTSAGGRMTITVDRPGQVTTVPLYRVPGYLGDDVVHVEAWDVSEGMTGSMAIVAPTDGTGSAPSCTWLLDGGPLPAAVSVDGCTITGVFSFAFNASVLTVDIAVPADYGCANSAIEGCWFSVEVNSASSWQLDTSTWSARVL